ncbi:hypothetical protein [Actinocorallia populi]|uniref:hypothetical protein n=1 Tax=Actinocorallia populi TaxID=2079200 RepID=UPI00130068CE|nr:hypothetical protein [Actinocorallia populi]
MTLNRGSCVAGAAGLTGGSATAGSFGGAGSTAEGRTDGAGRTLGTAGTTGAAGAAGTTVSRDGLRLFTGPAALRGTLPVRTAASRLFFAPAGPPVSSFARDDLRVPSFASFTFFARDDPRVPVRTGSSAPALAGTASPVFAFVLVLAGSPVPVLTGPVVFEDAGDAGDAGASASGRSPASCRDSRSGSLTVRTDSGRSGDPTTARSARSAPAVPRPWPCSWNASRSPVVPASSPRSQPSRVPLAVQDGGNRTHRTGPVTVSRACRAVPRPTSIRTVAPNRPSLLPGPSSSARSTDTSASAGRSGGRRGRGSGECGNGRGA